MAREAADDHSPGVECGVLACMMLHPSGCYEALRHGVKRDWFYSPRNGLIFTAVRELFEEGADHGDLVLLEQRCGEISPGDPTVWNYASEVFRSVPTRHALGQYLPVLEQLHLRRVKRERATYAAELYRLGDVEEADAVLAQAMHAGQDRTVLPTRDMAIDELETDLRAERAGKATGITTGFNALDYLTGGWIKAALYLLAGLPSMGKTAIALQLITAAALAGASVHYWSLEMQRTQMLRRMAASIAGVPLKARLVRSLDEDQRERVEGALKILRGLEVTIDDRTRTLPAMIQQARALRGVTLFVIDHARLVEVPDARTEYQQVTAVSGAAKRVFAGELEASCLVLSQFNREAARELAAGKGGGASHQLRGSGALEEDADFGMTVRRESYQGRSESIKGCIEVWKNRISGDCGTVKLAWDAAVGRFYEPGANNEEAA